jgi:hypothetical protein
VNFLAKVLCQDFGSDKCLKQEVASLKRVTTPSFIQEFELLEPRHGGFKEIDQVENCSRRLYNATLGNLKKKVEQVKASQEWKEARTLPKGSRARNEAFRAALIRAELTENQVDRLMKDLRQGEFKDFIGSHVAQKIGIRAFSAISKLISGKGKRVRFKKRTEFFSFEGKDNKSFLRFLHPEGEAPYVQLREKQYLVRVDPGCPYQKHALDSRCKYVRVVKRKIQGRVRYFAQLICEGTPYQDFEKTERHQVKMEQMQKASPWDSLLKPEHEEEISSKYKESVCLDFGPKNVAISTSDFGFEREICKGLLPKKKEIRILQRAMDRSRRVMNPENFNFDKTIKKGKKLWNKSNQYIQLQTQLADLYRKQTAHRKSIQGDLANDVIVLGNCIKFEKVSYKGFQKLYGKSIGLNAPSNLQDMLTRKAVNARGRVERINTFETKLSQTCLCGNQVKKPLFQRIHQCRLCGLGVDGPPISRDLFSAFSGVFTENTEKKQGKKVTYSSTLNLDQANLAMRGHRILSRAGLKSKNQTQTSKENSCEGVEQSAVEGSAKKCDELLLRVRSLSKDLEKRERVEA